jgi:hypothetical protein
MLLAERYARATQSGNLRNDALHVTTDVLMAMALSSNFGGLLVRVKYGNDASCYRRLLDKWTWIVSTKALRRNWPEHIPIDKIAYLSLRRWLNSVCPACTGHGKVKVLGAPVLSEKDCPLCLGKGETELRCNPAIRDYVLDMVEELQMDLIRGVTRANKRLRSDSEDANAKLGLNPAL